MSVSNVSLDTAVGTSNLHSTVRQARQDFEQLFQSLQSGDLAAAQQAYNSVQQLQAGQTGSTTTQTGTSAGTTSTASPVATDWSSLGQALQAGNLSSAQTTLTQLETDAQTVWQAHIQQEAQTAQSVYALMQSAQGAATTTGTPSAATTVAATPVQTDLTALGQALQSGDTSSAQTLLAKLVQDLQTSGQASGQSYGGHHHHHHGGLNATTTTTAVGSTSGTTSTTATGASPTLATVGSTSATSSTATGTAG